MSEDFVEKLEVLKTRGSLENFKLSRIDKDKLFVSKFEAFKYPFVSKNKMMLPHSDSTLEKTSGESLSKILNWDPWNKLSRKNKDNKKRKLEKSQSSSQEHISSPIIKTVEYKFGKDIQSNSRSTEKLQHSYLEQETENYKYSCQHKTKVVDFVKEVLVIYFTNNGEITKVIEPLKKELEQQVRNKEMRRGHIPCTIVGKKQIHG